MKFTLLFAVAALLATPGDPGEHSSRSSRASLPSSESSALISRASDASISEVRIGDMAPNFSYQGSDGRWRRLRDIVTQGPVLLTFGADELTLRVLEHERERLTDLGVIPVAVVDARSRAAQAMVQRLGLRFMVLTDTRGTIASQFNAVDPTTGRHLPTWFVLDRKRHVCGMSRRGLPLRGYASLAANALGLPLTGATVPSSSRSPRATAR